MATNFLSTSNPFTLQSSSLTKPTYFYYHPIKSTVKKDNQEALNLPIITKRCFLTTFLFSLAGKNLFDANAAILEADDDIELLEKVKRDRKQRLERESLINSSKIETGYLQQLVYKLSEVGQAIENNDLSAAGSVLGEGTDTDWVKKANIAFDKLSSSPEEKTEVDTFNSSLASLISSVSKKDIESSKLAFVSSASAFEKWTSLTGLAIQLKGL
ncbi:PREDICTED: thylakoid lumenal 16.5 kDa protein, chloroplastic-like isoform X2 [Lupinus angustifolius]|uniref:thylakoid lumenal 16.5 kDa protein, chloroplastic-like isoform X2 n=1 Tax=Lupinus angustifolius TaxID=3871 RepID=UPI00092E38C1|nr:PREDICTED: thylakoid lumenal 16.5 kDa protein, chloroplastic-like isoform X2 [Lupinus angustifolius]